MPLPEDVCEHEISRALQQNPVASRLVAAMEEKGCRVPRSAIACRPCNGAMQGRFDPAGITICSDIIGAKAEVATTVSHELVHAYDFCRANMDITNCKHMACTEIRAASLSGDCAWSNEMLRGRLAGGAGHQACVRRRAVLSMTGSACEAKAMEHVNEVWDSCFKDTAPFKDIPTFYQ
jgi:inner membrane protease ATP23